MYRKPPIHPLAQRAPAPDVARARAIIEQLLAERDALGQQLESAHQQVRSLQRQLATREDENAHLLQALRARSVGSAPPDARLGAVLSERDTALSEAARLRERLLVVEGLARRCEIERDEASAERDRAAAAQQHAEAALDELRESSPDAARLQRLAADLANVRRQRDQQIEAGIVRERARLLGELATVRDSVSAALGRNPDPTSPWYAGLLAVQAQIDGALHREGAKVVGQRGERFDPRVHEAVATAPSDGEPGMVLEVLGHGIALEDDTLVRPARVIVSAG